MMPFSNHRSRSSIGPTPHPCNRWLIRLSAFSFALAPTPAFAVHSGSEQAAEHSAQTETDFQSRIDRAWHYGKIANLVRDSLAPPQWFPEGDGFVHWAASGPNAGTWVVVDASTAQQNAVLSATELKAQLVALVEGEVAIPANLPYKFEPTQRRLLFQIGGRGFALDLGSRQVVALADEDLTSKVARQQAAASPDGRFYLLPKPGGFSIVDRTGRTIVERKGEQYLGWQGLPGSWSPDGRHVLATRVDERNVHKVPIVKYDPIETVDLVPYAKSGTPLPGMRLYLVDATTGVVSPLPALDGEGYSWSAGWRPDGQEALILHLSRDGKRLDLIGFDPAKGTARTIVREERRQSFVGALDFATGGWQRQVKALDGNRGFLWMSERDGWRHAYLYDWSGKLTRQVTHGEYVVDQALGLTPANDEILVVASAAGPTPYDRKLYRTPLAGGEMTRVSTQPGDHQISLSPSGRYYSVGYSTYTQPRRAAVGSTAGGDALQYLEADVTALSGMDYRPPEPFTVLAADGETPLHGVIFKPRDFSEDRRYPVINYVYAGPFTTIVPRGFVASSMGPSASMASSARAMAQMGFVVVMVDGRGTPGRSKAFQDVNYGRIGQTEIPDQVSAIRQAGMSRPYMDLHRVGIFGHSWGGYFATRGMLTAPGFYKAGYAGAQGMLEENALINEPNMGLPSLNTEGYEAGSNPRLAGNLAGAYKMMHGTSDTNATLSTTMRMVDALIKAGKAYELLIMPGVAHNPPPPFDRYYFEDQMRFFIRHLGGPQ